MFIYKVEISDMQNNDENKFLVMIIKHFVHKEAAQKFVEAVATNPEKYKIDGKHAVTIRTITVEEDLAPVLDTAKA